MTRNLYSLLLAGPALVQVVPAAAQGKGVVMVSDLRGSATLGDGTTAVTLMQELPAGSVVLLAKDARITFVNMTTGAESSCTGPGKLTLDPTGNVTGLALTSQPQVAALKGARNLKPSALAQPSIVLRGLEDLVMTPTGATLSPSPEFSWPSAGPKATYHFKLKDEQGQVLFEVTQEACSVKVPDHFALPDDMTYRWVLATDLHNGTSTRTEGIIKVFGPKGDRVELEATRPGPDASFIERLIYASLMERCGLHEEARRFWKVLAKERPDDQALAKFANN